MYFLLSIMSCCLSLSSFFFFNDTATTEIYTLSLHDALPISDQKRQNLPESLYTGIWWYARFPDHYSGDGSVARKELGEDRKSTRLNSSHSQISYAVFCLKKKKTIKHTR